MRAEIQDTRFERERDLVFMASVIAAAFVARADGWVDPAERDQLVDWAGATPLLDSFEPAEIADAFDTSLRLIERGGIESAIHTLRLAAGAAEARLILAGATQVAQADGHEHPSETAALQLVRRTLFATL